MMKHMSYSGMRYTLLGIIGILLLALFVTVSSTFAINALPTPDPKPGSYGLEAVKMKAPPKRGATITVPGNGASFGKTPTTVSGICPTSLLVQVYNNGVMAGAVMCRGGSFSLQVSLFPGRNELSALVFDELGQEGPKSNTVRVTYRDADFISFGEVMTLTSSYGRRSAPAGDRLTWPLQLSGGTGPYAFSIDWGDGSEPELKSQALAGVININHVYKKAGIYIINVRVTDSKGVSAFIQLIAVANGKVDGDTGSQKPAEEKTATAKPEILWIPTIILFILLLPTYWLGRRSMLISIRNKMLKERDSYQQNNKQ
ncbi:MAG TPA: hypothetical protein VGE13_02620 [Candidatus Saccharimonadales bacterium]